MYSGKVGGNEEKRMKPGASRPSRSSSPKGNKGRTNSRDPVSPGNAGEGKGRVGEGESGEGRKKLNASKGFELDHVTTT